MDQFLVIRCEGKDDVEALIELLRAELRERNWYFRVGSGGNAYYTVQTVAEDVNQVTVIDTTPPELEDEE